MNPLLKLVYCFGCEPFFFGRGLYQASKEWCKSSHPPSEANMNESGRALVEACDNAKVLTRLLRQHGVSVTGHALGFDQIVCED